nr:hypothetical protein [Halomonas sp. UBA3074]
MNQDLYPYPGLNGCPVTDHAMPGTGWQPGHESTGQALAPPMPLQNRNGALRRSRKDRNVGEICQLLRSHFIKGVTELGAQLLIYRPTAMAGPLEVDGYIDKIQSLVFNQSGLSVTRAEVEHALAVLRGDDSLTVEINVSVGLTVMSWSGILYMKTSDGILEFDARGSYKLPQYIDAPIGFLRLENGRPATFPPYYGSINHEPLEDLLAALNVPENVRLLLVAWMLATLLPNAQNVLLEIVGGRYTGKSTLQQALKHLLDPSIEPLTVDIHSQPKALFDQAKRDFILSLDSVERLPGKMQRGLLELLQGKLTEISPGRRSASTQVRIEHPIVLNSLASLVSEPELADRSILVRLPPIEAFKDRYLEELTKINRLHDGFGSLVTLLSQIAPRWQHISIVACPPGLMDFYRIGVAAAEAMGLGPEAFDEQMKACMEQRYELELHEYPIVEAVQSLLEASGQDNLEMPAGKLLEALEGHRPERAQEHNWPRSPRQLGPKLEESKALMKANGVTVESAGRKGKESVYHWKINKCSPQLYYRKWDLRRDSAI